MSASLSIGRFEDKKKTVFTGIVHNDRVLELDRAANPVMCGHALKDLKTLSPVNPSKLVCVGLNYLDHARQANREIPPEPLLFLKAPTSIIGTNQNILYPGNSSLVMCEGELVVIIGREACKVSEENALEYVYGYTCGNDVSARDIQKSDGQWMRAKSFDTFAPLGPYAVVSDLDPNNLDIEVRLNGKVQQKSNTGMMAFNVQKLISYISWQMTLYPGDAIMTGTPGNTPVLNVGDVVEIEIEGIGVLRNAVASA